MFPISDSVPHRRFPFLNLAIILITIYIFYIEITAPNLDAFLQHYALIPSHIDFANYSTLWPFITAIFLHGGFLHIISNLWFLWVFGDNVEDRFGIFYPIFYLICGILGNLLQYVLMPTSSVPMLGASGAIAGVLGAYFVLFPHSKVKTLAFFGFPLIVSIGAPIMLGYWFFLQIISGATSIHTDGGGVAFWAHVGGFLAGVILAKFLREEHVVEGEVISS